jgi:hypothetical protein
VGQTGLIELRCARFLSNRLPLLAPAVGVGEWRVDARIGRRALRANDVDIVDQIVEQRIAEAIERGELLGPS